MGLDTKYLYEYYANFVYLFFATLLIFGLLSAISAKAIKIVLINRTNLESWMLAYLSVYSFFVLLTDNWDSLEGTKGDSKLESKIG